MVSYGDYSAYCKPIRVSKRVTIKGSWIAMRVTMKVPGLL